ncbi:MAG TPA: metallopeptidase TldD-related protein [Polyangiaceae bacterium]|nr:metallopeptidase TldD-related protein [Polyangiaceae bacterium]
MSDDDSTLMDLAGQVVEKARAQGATVAEASAGSGWELSTRVRLGEVELVEEAGTRSLSLRVIKEGRVAMTATSDLTPAGIQRCIDDAIELADLSEVDPWAGPAEAHLLAHEPFPDLDLFDPKVADVDANRALEIAKAAEAAALGFDKRLSLSDGASFSRVTSTRALVLSSGFSGLTRGSYASLTVSPVAEDADKKRRRGYYWTAKRHFAELEAPAAVGEEAARRTLAKLGSRRVPTTEAPVVFEADIARSLIGTLAGCIVGSAVWRKSTYLLDRENTPLASDLVTIVDDPLIPRAPGSRPFDGEGLASRENLVVEAGVLKTFLLDCYSARKLNRTSTASAARSGGSIGPSTTNFILRAGAQSKDDIVASVDRGLYVTEMMGFGFNPITGDFSRGASGFWIENGKLAFPVSEVTISSTLDKILLNIDAVGDDLDLKTSTASPTFRTRTMTIAGA